MQTPAIHHDKDLFREAITFTSAETGFLPRLIEKDYFCTVLLGYLSQDDQLVFKGGTCLAKIHAGFYRLSEDLDFTISTELHENKKQRAQKMIRFKQLCADLEKTLPEFRIARALTGANQSTQYVGAVEYVSNLSGGLETIKIEVSLREPLLEDTVTSEAQTILLHPVSGQSIIPPTRLRAISKREAYAEKLRAALSRREPAIRDFYDLDYAVRKLSLQVEEAELQAMLLKKLQIPGNELQQMTDARISLLQDQLESELKPVLRESDYADFDLARAIKLTSEIRTNSDHKQI